MNKTREQIVVKSDEERNLLEDLEKREDTEAQRMKRFLAMSDLSRTEGSPIKEIVDRAIEAPCLANLDIMRVPEIVSTKIGFDLFDFPADHPARSKSDTYYIDEDHILRTQTTVMWYYFLEQEKIKEKIRNEEPVGSICFGKVYRKDEIDRHHMNVFHQIDGWYLIPKKHKEIGVPELQQVLIEVAQAVFGKDVRYRFNPDTFPYTDPSIEMEIEINGNWVEVLGSGVVKGSVLKLLGVDPDVYNGWAFGFGLERLAIISMELPDIRLLWSDDERVKKQLKLGQKFEDVSKYPPAPRDISFIVSKGFEPNNYFDLIRDVGGDLVEEVELLDKYENEAKFGKDKVSYTYRVIYRHPDKTMTSEEVSKIQAELEQRTISDFDAEIRVS